MIIADEQPDSPSNPTAFGVAGMQLDRTKWIHYDGRIRVWEIETQGSMINRLAIDFVLRSKRAGEKPGAGGDRLLVGMYRWRSTFE
jgi:hypothetical protein